MRIPTRRAFVQSLVGVAIGGWATKTSVASAAGLQSRGGVSRSSSPIENAASDEVSALYGPVSGEPFPIPALDLRRIDRAFLRAAVMYDGSEPPGTIVINPQSRYLYLVQDGGRALRYGIGVGRAGFGWSGTATVKYKREWPDWYPPAEMIARQPELERKLTGLQSGVGMPGGPGNPLGARALYLWQGNQDTLYRIHGTVEPWTIGKRVSSGCIRMINHDAVDLYNRVPLETQVVVLSGGRGDEVASRPRRDPAFDDIMAPESTDTPRPRSRTAGRNRAYERRPPDDPYATFQYPRDIDPYSGRYRYGFRGRSYYPVPDDDM